MVVSSTVKSTMKLVVELSHIADGVSAVRFSGPAQHLLSRGRATWVALVSTVRLRLLPKSRPQPSTRRETGLSHPPRAFQTTFVTAQAALWGYLHDRPIVSCPLLPTTTRQLRGLSCLRCRSFGAFIWWVTNDVPVGIVLDMGRGDSLARQLQLWMLLDKERALSVEDVCERLAINRRTLYRDLDVLQRCGMPLWQDQVGRQVRWRLDDGFNRSLKVELSVHEAMALVAAERLLSSMAGTIFASAAHTAVDKVRGQLAEPIRKRLAKMVGGVSASAGASRNLTTKGAHLDELLRAIEHDRVVSLTYQRLGALKSNVYTVEPHHLHLHGSSLYLVAWAVERKASRIFLLDRVSAVKSLDRSFERRPELPLGVFEQGAFGLWEGRPVSVRLRFKGTASRIVAEQRLHPSQTSVRGPNGTLDVALRVPLSPSLLAWVRGFKGRVEVLAPPQLQSDV